jgi:hypothetical protein
LIPPLRSAVSADDPATPELSGSARHRDGQNRIEFVLIEQQQPIKAKGFRRHASVAARSTARENPGLRRQLLLSFSLVTRV